MTVLLMRLQGPMQSWGVQSRFPIRETGLEPSKSGVIGLLCAALGRPRSAPVADLARLQMGVRVDREGFVRSDYHTAQNVLRAGGGRKETELSTRWYLSDACFLVALAGGDDTLLREADHALRNPVWPLFLGRKSFVPSDTVWLQHGIVNGTGVEATLREFPRLARPQTHDRGRETRVVLEDSAGVEQRRDVPISFLERTFAVRSVNTHFWPDHVNDIQPQST